MAPFDLPRMEPNCTSRNSSTVSPQSLLLMNSEFVLTRAKHFAQRVQREAGDETSARITRAWQLAFAATPDNDELAEAVSFLEQQTSHFTANPASDTTDKQNVDPASEALASFCHALLSSNRFLYID